MCNLGIEKRERIFAFSGLFKNKNDFRKEDCLFSFYFCIMNYWSLRTMCVFVHWRCICEIHLDFMRYSRICWYNWNLRISIFWKRWLLYITCLELWNYSFIFYDSWMKRIFVKLVDSEPYLKSNLPLFSLPINRERKRKITIFSSVNKIPNQIIADHQFSK